MLTHWSLRGHLHGPLCDNLSAMLKARGGCITAHTRCNWFLFRVPKSVPVLGTCFGRRFEGKTAHVRCNLVLVLGTEIGSRFGYLFWFQACSRWVFTYQRTMGTDLGTHFEHPFWFQF